MAAPKKKSFQQQLLELQDPTPKEFDPEELEITASWRPNKEDNNNTNQDKVLSVPRSVGSSSLRDISLLSGKYAGKQVTRKQLEKLNKDSTYQNDSEEADDGSLEDEDEEEEEEEDGGEMDEATIEAKMDRLFAGLDYDSQEEEEGGDQDEDGDEELELEGEDSEDDLKKFLGGLESDSDEQQQGISSEDEVLLEEEKEEEDNRTTKTSTSQLGSKRNAMEEADRLERELQEEEQRVVKAIAPQANEEEKAAHTHNQQFLWNQMLDSRIRIQGPLLSANRFPQPNMYSVFLQDQKVTNLLKEVTQDVKTLLDDMIELQDSLFDGNPEVPQHQENGTPSKKRKISEINSLDDVWNEVKERSERFTPYQNETIDKWNQRTLLASGQNLGKQFKAVNQSVLVQIDQLLQNNRDRLTKKTQLKRTNIRVIAKTAKTETDSKDNGTITTQQKEEYDEEIFDDTDFYQQILKEVIESGAQGLHSSQYLVEKSKLRKNLKKDVDRKASKGRKLRYKVHDKLVGFMVPSNSYNSESSGRDWNSELFATLFGSH